MPDTMTFEDELRDRPGVAIVSELQLDDVGVDPIGLRQLNLDLMDRAYPGINNVTSYIRPYAFMAWAWHKAAEVASQGGKIDPNSAVMKDLVDRYEVLWAWSHCLTSAPGLVGYTVLRPRLPLKHDPREFIFSGPDWEALRKARRTNTGVMAAVQYGPSIKALRWLLPAEDGTFRPSTQAEQAIRKIDSITGAAVPARLLAIDPPAVTADEIADFATHLPAVEASEEERTCFAKLFYELGSEASAADTFVRRRHSLDLIRSILGAAGEPLSLARLRRAFASASAPPNASPEIHTSLTVVAALQVRQLQRLAIEAMLVWVERRIEELGYEASTERLAQMAEDEARSADPDAGAPSVGEYLQNVASEGEPYGWPEALAKGDTDVVGLIHKIVEAQRHNPGQLPALCLRAYAIVDAATKGLRRWGIVEGGSDPLAGRPERLPPTQAATRLQSLRHGPMVALWRDVIEVWVIGQHVRWSAMRGGDGKKRLRLALEGSSWIRVRPGYSGPFEPTPDRLGSLMRLSSACGLVVRETVNGEECYRAA